MNKIYFTLEQANDMIPTLEKAFYRMQQMHRQILALFQSLETKGFVPDQANFAISIEGATEEMLDELTSLKMLLDELQNQLVQLIDQGAIVKDLEAGLVDWYAKKGENEILLCWKYGEKQVNYWHEIDTGFQGRKPLSEL